MPLYFFDVTDTGNVFPDTEGTQLAGLGEARHEALRTLGEIAKDKLPDGDFRTLVIEIRESNGPVILTASLSLNVSRDG
jgi:hypothetical protein